MLKANHSYLAELLFRPYIFRLMKNSFHSISIFGTLPEISHRFPIILAPNHSTWWDGFFVYLINNQLFSRKFFIMILEEQLSKYKFFTKLGGYSINQNSPKSIIESLNYTNSLIEKFNNPLITIFPQGILEPQFKNPIKVGRGIDKIIQKSDKEIAILPLSIRTEFYKEQYPEVFLKFGNARIVMGNTNFSTVNLEDELLTLYYEIGISIQNNEERNILLSGKTSISQRSKDAFNKIKINNS